MLRLATVDDVPAINAILNHPDVYPGATRGRDLGKLDIERGFGCLLTLIREDAKGCFIFDPYCIDTVEVHTCLTKEARGPEAETSAREALRYVFARTGCREVLTSVMRDAKAVDLFTRQIGFVRVSDTPDSEIRTYQLTLERWPSTDEGLESLCPPVFSDAKDSHLRRMLGVLVLTGTKGLLGKGVALYNKHARLHGFTPLDMIGLESVALAGRALHFKDGSYTVEDPWQPQGQ